MRIANLAGRLVLVTPAGAIDVATASGGRFGPDPTSVYRQWDEFVAAAGDLLAHPGEPFTETALAAPVPEPRQVLAIGLNYRAHAAETGATVPPIPATFTKFPSCLTGPFAAVALPSASVDWEVELVLVIGREARNVAAEHAWSHVAGLTIGQDLSERIVQRAAGGQFCLGKSYTGFGPTGPWVVTVDEFTDPDDLGLGCRVNAEVMQNSRTDDMAYPVPELIERLSAVLTLYPGDLIFTGTPSGVGAGRTPQVFLKPGDVVESWIEGIGTIRNRMVAP
jgi:2-keto-4-pentenoate hydratase/2-oxohepta-3-ene-1,7-dioic acid hydratase in catechol pathway